MTRYRYRTETLVGPWRASRLEAEIDAVAVGQARVDERHPNQIHWQVPGEIEVSAGEPDTRRTA